jgi:hypothetical protein
VGWSDLEDGPSGGGSSPVPTIPLLASLAGRSGRRDPCPSRAVGSRAEGHVIYTRVFGLRDALAARAPAAGGQYLRARARVGPATGARVGRIQIPSGGRLDRPAPVFLPPEMVGDREPGATLNGTAVSYIVAWLKLIHC